MADSKPGTLYRIYSDDKHYTAVQLKDGSVLEVKNPDTGKKTTFASVEEWQASHSATEVKTDASKASGVILPRSKANGFNCPENKTNPNTSWLYWCYEIMAEGAPHLLTNEEVKTAYNQFRAVCEKYASEFRFHTYSFMTRKSKYSPENLKYRTTYKSIYGETIEDKWCGLNAYFHSDVFGRALYPSLPNKLAFSTVNENNTVRAEICSAYKKLYDLIQSSLIDFLTKKYKLSQAEVRVQLSKAALSRVQKKLAKLQKFEECYKKDYENAVKLLAELQV